MELLYILGDFLDGSGAQGVACNRHQSGGTSPLVINQVDGGFLCSREVLVKVPMPLALPTLGRCHLLAEPIRICVEHDGRLLKAYAE